LIFYYAKYGGIMINKIERDRRWREKNPNYFKEWHKKNPEANAQWYGNHRKERAEEIRKWKNNNPEKQRIYRNRWSEKKYNTDFKYKLNMIISGAIVKSLKSKKINRFWEKLVGYNLSELKAHLIKTIPKGYDWQDFLNGWLQIDHIIPKRAFIFDSPEDEEFKQCWSLCNLRLTRAEKNQTKHCTIENPILLGLLISQS